MIIGVDTPLLPGFAISQPGNCWTSEGNAQGDGIERSARPLSLGKGQVMDMEIYFPGGKRVYADYGAFTIETDQPARGGGDDSAPAPFDLFLASIGTCAGIYALNFLQQRGIEPGGSKLTMRTHFDPAAGLIDKIVLELETPVGFPDKYRDAVVNAMNLCAVKKHLDQPPSFEITTVAG